MVGRQEEYIRMPSIDSDVPGPRCHPLPPGLQCSGPRGMEPPPFPFTNHHHHALVEVSVRCIIYTYLLLTIIIFVLPLYRLENNIYVIDY